MWTELLYAVDERGKEYPFEQQRFNGGLLLTLKKEMFQKAKQLLLLPALSTAEAGDAGCRARCKPSSPRAPMRNIAIGAR